MAAQESEMRIRRPGSPDRSRTALVRATLVAACFVAMLTVYAGPGAAQIATITFPDTPVRSSATVKCPTTTVSICFGGSTCSASGTVQSVSGPSAPFSINKFNLLSSAEFFAGSCEAHPVSLPVNVGAGQILAYQAAFSPTAGGTFNGTLTFSTSGGPATANLTGKGIAARTDRGGVLLISNAESVVPGSGLDMRYRTTKGTLQGNVDLYLVVAFPSGQLLFVTDQGAVVPAVTPFRRNFSVTDTTQTLFSDRVPLDSPFGTYTFYMVMAYAGTDALDSRNWASAITSATVSYSALSAAQTSIKSARGNPDLLVVTWMPDVNQKQETWMYFSGTPNKFVFLNGVQTGQDTVSLPLDQTGPKVDPALFTPQTTVASLTAALGPATSVTPVDGAPQFRTVSYAFGLDVILLNGRLSSAMTSHP